MEKKFSNREVAQIKRICQNVDGNYQKTIKLAEKIKALQEEYDALQRDIDEMEAPVVRKTGFKSTDLVEKVVTVQVDENGFPKKDKNGNSVKVTKYVLKYPETILPPVTENAGSDFDTDTTNEATETTEAVVKTEAVVEEETVDNFDFTRFNN